MIVENSINRLNKTAILMAVLMISTLLSALASPALAHSEGVPTTSQVTFTDVSEASGISLVDTGPLSYWASYGPGVSVDDCDQDGDMDVIVTARFDHLSYENLEFESGSIQFMLNNGDGTFTDWTANSGMNLGNTTVIGSSWADYDNDGDKDVYLSAFGESDVDNLESGERNILFKNNGNCVFTDVTTATGVGEGAIANAVVVNGNVTEVVMQNSGSNYAASGGLAPAIYFRDSSGNGAKAEAIVTGDGEISSVIMTDGGEGYDEENPPQVIFVSGVANYGHSTTAIWADYDHDGDVDLYSMNLGIVNEELYWARTETNFLYRNDGDIDGDGEIEFSDVTNHAGVSGQAEVSDAPNQLFLSGLYRMDQASPSNPSTMAQIASADHRGTGLSFAGVWFDYNNDGWEDLYVASDFGMSPIYHNNRDGTFTVVTEQLDMDLPGTGMGAHAGDWNGDGYLDLCHSNFGPNYLWENEGGNSFSENSRNLGFRDNGSAGSFVAVNWACQFFDYDLDGDLDIFFGVGRINRFTAYNNNTLYRNDGDIDGDGYVNFVDISGEIGLRTGFNGNKTMGASIFDYDNDGDLDIMLGHSDRAPQLFSNNAVEETGRHWLKVQLEGRQTGVNTNQDSGQRHYSNSYGTGCLVIVTLEDGHELRQHVYAGSGFLGSNEPTVHFGLDTDDSVKSVEVVWSTGITQIERNVNADQTLVMQEPTSMLYEVFDLGLHQNVNSAIYFVMILILIGVGFKLSTYKNNSTSDNEKPEEE